MDFIPVASATVLVSWSGCALCSRWALGPFVSHYADCPSLRPSAATEE